uniref:Uncharacterized protein n=1 Tax=Tanacetum cinerariifolium TaxID=118510 RepID=A0A6L2JQM2_TANCI|nr:hypothetical protein [Tanacetum cinerariifolium]
MWLASSGYNIVSWLGLGLIPNVITLREEINALAQKGKQRGHLLGVGRVLPGQATDVLSPPSPQCTHNSADVEKLKKKNKHLTKQVNLMMKLFRSDDKFSQMLNQYESSPEFSNASGSGECEDDEMADDEDGGEDEEYEEMAIVRDVIYGEMPLYCPSWQKVPVERKATIVTKIGIGMPRLPFELIPGTKPEPLKISKTRQIARSYAGRDPGHLLAFEIKCPPIISLWRHFLLNDKNNTFPEDIPPGKKLDLLTHLISQNPLVAESTSGRAESAAESTAESTAVSTAESTVDRSKGYKLPPSYYAIKKTFKTIGFGYESIHVCEHDCCIFRGDDNKDLDFCPVCNTSRWKDSNIPGKKVPKKVLRYFPIIPRLQRLYKSSHTANEMIWHATGKCTEPGKMQHQVDGRAWKKFDTKYPDFAKEPRNVRLGLAADGFNPFGNLSQAYNMPHMESPNWTKINAGIQPHLQKAYNANKAAFKVQHWVIDPTTGTYNVEKIRRERPENITASEWNKYIEFWNDARNIA